MGNFGGLKCNLESKCPDLKSKKKKELPLLNPYNGIPYIYFLHLILQKKSTKQSNHNTDKIDCLMRKYELSLLKHIRTILKLYGKNTGPYSKTESNTSKCTT